MIPMALALAAASPQAASPQMTLGEFVQLCGTPGNSCRFYILGVMEGTSIAARAAKDSQHFCIPEGVSVVEVTANILGLARKDMARFPQDAALPAISFVSATFLKVYPCPGAE